MKIFTLTALLLLSTCAYAGNGGGTMGFVAEVDDSVAFFAHESAFGQVRYSVATWNSFNESWQLESRRDWIESLKPEVREALEKSKQELNWQSANLRH